MTPDLSLIIPCYNEEENIPTLYNEIKKTLATITSSYELLFINDGSTDKSVDILIDLKKKDPQITIVSFSRNFGYEPALKAGLDIAHGKYIAIIDADLQDPVPTIATLYKTLVQGYDVVLAQRSSRKDPIRKKASARVFYRIFDILSGQNIPKDVGYFRIFTKQVLTEIRKFGEYNLFLKGIFSYVGFRIGIVQFERAERFAGKTKFSLSKLCKLGFRGIFSFSSTPLQIITGFGILCATTSFIIGFIQIILKIFHSQDYQYGISTIVVFFAFMSGIQMIFLGILGTYVGRTYEETKKRPHYIIQSIQ